MSNDRTTAQSDIMEGYIDHYDPEKNFGFACVGRQRVFFHLSAQREVEGTPEEPIFTNRPSTEPPSWYKRMREPTRIIMRLTESPKGLKAQVWGIRPKRTWLENLVHYRTLTGYDGFEVELRYSRNGYRSQAHRKVLGRLTAEPELVLHDAENATLTIQFDQYRDHYSEPVERSVRHSFKLRRYDAHPYGDDLPHGRYVVDVPEGAGECVSIVFSPHWIGSTP
ncbi:MAG TPA: hypothetical protein VMT30_08990 [Candidatus Saccharimonadia bacterium]|nr:hypothetical protein [Candidatus Saccharimonadia bacterium]